MLIFKDGLPDVEIKKAVVSIGVFDGVHLGHAAIINKMRQTAQEIGGQSVIITFSNHPRCQIDKNFTFQMLTNQTNKMQLFEQMGIDIVVVLKFTSKLAQMSYTDFLSWIGSKIHIHTLVLGYNHCFGKNREGNIFNIGKILPEYGFDLIVVERLYVQNTVISSSKIRQALAEGNYELANTMLGRNCFLTAPKIN